MTRLSHVCIITPGFPTSEEDDSCVPYVQDFLQIFSMHRDDVQFSVIALQYPYTNESYNWKGIQVFPCGGKNKRFVGKVKTWVRANRILDKINKQQAIDAVHSLWLTETTLLAQHWSAKKKVPHVATAMGQDVLTSNKYLKLINLNKLELVVVSKFQQQVLERNVGKVSSCIIPWEVKKLNTARNKEIDILGVGSLIKVKQFDLFIEVLHRLGNSEKPIKVLIIGDGEEREELEQLASKLPPLISLEFLGHLNRKEVFEWMSKSKVLLHCSKFESQGFVFNESIASGMAVVSTPVGIAKNSDRWIVASSAEELAKAVQLKVQQQYDSRQLFSSEKMVEGYSQLYFSL